tara:strand:+ start:20343 stop:21344 length:1002 start_codon:yes stop_codon:yes gene_type:complete
MIDYPLVWGVLIATAILIYVILDGFDLGIGILFPFLENDEQRGTAMNTVAPVWDGNETWLILGGGGLFASFPLAYAVLMPALYMPILLMMFGLIFRGVSFEFRSQDKVHEKYWDIAFTGGSMLATLCQGIALGAFVQGIDVVDRAYDGGWWDWLSPFSLLTGVVLLIGYALLGATWLVMKTEGALREKAIRYSRITLCLTVGSIGLISLATLSLDAQFMQRWTSWPYMLYSSPVPVAIAAASYFLWRSLNHNKDYKAFLAAVALFVLSFLGLAINMYPYIVPMELTIWQAAAPDNSLSFLLVGTLFLLPMILGYTVYAYWVFRGKVKEGEGYH